MIRPAGMSAMSSATPRRRRSRCPFADAATAASATMSVIFANSDGCSWNDPSWNQACAPFDLEPNGDTTSNSTSTAGDEEVARPLAVLAVVDRRNDHEGDATDDQSEALTLHVVEGIEPGIGEASMTRAVDEREPDDG